MASKSPFNFAFLAKITFFINFLIRNAHFFCDSLTKIAFFSRDSLTESVFSRDYLMITFMILYRSFYETRVLFATIWWKSRFFSRFFDGICGFLRFFDKIRIFSPNFWQNSHCFSDALINLSFFSQSLYIYFILYFAQIYLLTMHT